MQHLLALGNTDREDSEGDTRNEDEVLKEVEVGRVNFCEGEEKQATDWRCGSMKQRSGSMQACSHMLITPGTVSTSFCSSPVK